jgi:hypothetical protein
MVSTNRAVVPSDSSSRVQRQRLGQIGTMHELFAPVSNSMGVGTAWSNQPRSGKAFSSLLISAVA